MTPSSQVPARHGMPSAMHAPARAAAQHRAGDQPSIRQPRLLGRQTIFTITGEPFACELLFRSTHCGGGTVDTWSAAAQDHASQDVIETALAFGLAALAGTRPVFVNATRSLLLGELTLPALPRQIGIEVVESVVADPAVLDGVGELRAAGHLIAVDDFTGTASQLRLLPYADIVKIDLRDLDRQGPDLLTRARAHGARTVVERVETPDALQRCEDLGFDLVQGNLLEPTIVLLVGSGPAVHVAAQDRADATVRTARSTANTGSRPAPLTSASA